mmetsp:Transcript_5638/g.9641  ORF Transcript_5638/g.9641 Transcript_5638/m.9641 type:complete len:225 (-) Transcript_5638:24-698(-)
MAEGFRITAPRSFDPSANLIAAWRASSLPSRYPLGVHSGIVALIRTRRFTPCSAAASIMETQVSPFALTCSRRASSEFVGRGGLPTEMMTAESLLRRSLKVPGCSESPWAHSTLFSHLGWSCLCGGLPLLVRDTNSLALPRLTIISRILEPTKPEPPKTTIRLNTMVLLFANAFLSFPFLCFPFLSFRHADLLAHEVLPIVNCAVPGLRWVASSRVSSMARCFN